MGNVAAGGLETVWRNPGYLDIRRRYLAGRTGGTLCAGCKVQSEKDFSYKPRRSPLDRLLRRPPLYRPSPPPGESS